MPCKWKTTLAKHCTLVVYHVRAPKGGAKKIGETSTHTLVVLARTSTIARPP